MLNLLIKDFKMMFGREKTTAAKVVTSIVSAIFVVCFILLEYILYSAVFGKIKSYENAPQAFVSLLLLIISLLTIVSGLLKAKKLFFNEKDIQQLTNYPVSNAQIIFSKLIFLFLSHYATTFMFIYPMFFAYGQVFEKTILFYYLALFYPVLSFFFEMGVALLLVYPVWVASQYLKKHILIKFILSLTLLFVGTYLYSQILTIFIDLVANNQLVTLFSKESMAKFIKFERFAIPVKFLCDVFIKKRTASFMPYICIALGVFVLGVTITVFTFHYVRNLSVTAKRSEKEFNFKPLTPVRALIKKELILITKNSDYIFSFSGLLVIQPLLLYLIVNAMNTVFSAGLFKFYLALIPNFSVLLDIFIVIMFTLIINQGANSYITMEERTIKNMKTIPVKYKTQLIIKTAIPFMLSFVSLFISVAVLAFTGVLSIANALIALLMATICLFVFDVISLKEELSIRHGKPRKTYLSSLYAYLLPFVYIVVGIVFSFLGTSLALIYLAGVLVLILCGIYPIVFLHQNMGALFMDLEAIN
ncbi:MAG: hypothetical protein IJA15_04780 [Clostridia bacterium]|nr:hypothetical protein [Clostridia bacterium]